MIRCTALLAAALGLLKIAVLFARASLAVQLLIGAGLLAGWVLSLLLHAFGRCWLCGGKGNLRRKRRRRAPRCPLCKGTGRRQRTGSRTVHRIRRQVAAHWRSP